MSTLKNVDCFTVLLDNTTGKSMSLYLCENVRNTPEIRKKLMSGELACCVIKATLVIDPLQVAVAANIAALREHRSKLTTKSIFTEILYAMSISSKITESLVTFGVHDDEKNIVIALIHKANDKKELEEKIFKYIDGERASILRIGEFTDEARVKKIYKIEDNELATSSLLYSVISRIGVNSSV